jgi:type VI secretion system secreted protein Hcp
MAVDAYVFFLRYDGSLLNSESQVDMSKNTEPLAKDDLVGYAKAGQLFEIEDYSFDVEQVLNIGSAGSGTGAGKITFNPFSITRPIDKSSPILFEAACSGQPYQQVGLALRKAVGTTVGGGASGQVFLRFDFKMAAVKTISWSHDDTSPKETTTFEYGGMLIRYCQQAADGSLMAAIPGGWNRVANVKDETLAKIVAR